MTQESASGFPISLDEIGELITSRTGKSLQWYLRSFQEREGSAFILARLGGEKKLVVAGGDPFAFDADLGLSHRSTPVLVYSLTSEVAEQLRALFPWTAPIPIGKTSALGCGDRLGLASPGHIRACVEKNTFPILAQQSIREMERTNRTPQEVLNDATWAAFQEGYTDGFGADADHLKTTEDIDVCFEAGYTMYTIDPSDHVNNEADHLNQEALDSRFEALPWSDLGIRPADCLKRYTEEVFKLDAPDDTVEIQFDETSLKRAAVKYGAAIAHTSNMARHLDALYTGKDGNVSYDLEMSVDETDHPTRPREHYFVAAELDRLGVEVTSLAPRFTGDFQKGIDFIGDRDTFEETFKKHAIVARHFGGYKLSIHSGSDKFSIFPIMGRHAGSHVHLKTAGTSFLEALRLPARHAPGFFRDIVAFAFERFDDDKKTYHVTTDLDAIPDPADVPDEELEETYLGDNNGRQLLHITYGSILTSKENGQPRFREQLYDILNEHEEEHYEALKSHFVRHIKSVGASSFQSEMEKLVAAS